jgi:hypothetical protein
MKNEALKSQAENAKFDTDSLDLEMNEAEGQDLPSVAAEAETSDGSCCCCCCCC